ncbi:MAG: FeoA family protein [bacterium]
MTTIDLSQMVAGQTGRIISFNGGRGLVQRLESMGIRLGVQITKVSGQLMRGPVVVRLGNTQVAIGFGMARKILVEVH